MPVPGGFGGRSERRCIERQGVRSCDEGDHSERPTGRHFAAEPFRVGARVCGSWWRDARNKYLRQSGARGASASILLGGSTFMGVCEVLAICAVSSEMTGSDGNCWAAKSSNSWLSRLFLQTP